jgi:hypothetical protein
MVRFRFAARNIRDKLVKCLRQPAFMRFYVNAYLIRPLRGQESDAWLVSYPKCGRTWVMYLLRSYFETALGAIHPDKPDRFELPGGGALQFTHDQGNWVPAPPSLGQLAFDEKRYRGKKVVFLVRDPRDVLVSSWHHLVFRESIYWGTLSDFVREDIVGVRKVVAFMNLWLQHRHIPDGFLLVSYEDLKRDPYESLRTILDFVGVTDHAEAAIARALELSSFENMRKAEQARASASPWLNPGSKPVDKAMKTRKGKVGGYREEMTDDDVAYVDRIIDSELCDELAMYKSRA